MWNAYAVGFNAVCRKGPQNSMSFRTSPQTGVGIPRIDVEATGLGTKMFENPGDCHGSLAPQRCAERNRRRRLLARSSAHCLAMTWFFNSLKGRCDSAAPPEWLIFSYSLALTASIMATHSLAISLSPSWRPSRGLRTPPTSGPPVWRRISLIMAYMLPLPEHIL